MEIKYSLGRSMTELKMNKVLKLQTKLKQMLKRLEKSSLKMPLRIFSYSRFLLVLKNLMLLQQ